MAGPGRQLRQGLRFPLCYGSFRLVCPAPPASCLSSSQVVSTGKDSVEGVFTIVSYNLAQKLGPKLKQAAFRVIVCDEAHYLKNDKAKRTEAILPLLQAARRVLLLTGRLVL